MSPTVQRIVNRYRKKEIVSSQQAKADWQGGRFKLPAHDDQEFIPLPEGPMMKPEPEPMS